MLRCGAQEDGAPAQRGHRVEHERVVAGELDDTVGEALSALEAAIGPAGTLRDTGAKVTAERPKMADFQCNSLLLDYTTVRLNIKIQDHEHEFCLCAVQNLQTVWFSKIELVTL